MEQVTQQHQMCEEYQQFKKHKTFQDIPLYTQICIYSSHRILYDNLLQMFSALEHNCD